MSQQVYLKVPLVVAAIKKEFQIDEVNHNITSKTNNRGQTYNQIHFSRADHTPIVQYVYCKLVKGEPYVLAASFKQAMDNRPKMLDTATEADAMALLF